MVKRNLVMGIVAHVDSGKTTLSEGLLYENGSIRSWGRVDNGDTFLDTYSLEKERGITIFSKQAILENEDTRITLLDTPGHVDFSAEMERALSVIDAAVLVISALDGVQGHTKTVWKLLKQHQIPCIIFVNKMDMPDANKEDVLAELKDELSDCIVDFSDDYRKTGEFYEQIAVCEERLLEQFLETGVIDDRELIGLIADRYVYPCFFGSALKMDGVKVFLEFLLKYIKAPEYGEEFGARVFKITRDEQGNRLTHMKVTGGMLKSKVVLSGVSQKHQEWSEKVNQIRVYSGDKFESISEAGPGTICAVTGLTETYPLEGLGNEQGQIIPVLEPVLSYRIELPEEIDALSMLPKLKQLEEEEPQLHIEWDEKLKELKAKLMGEVQLDIIQHQILERFGVKIQWQEGKILYKETIADTVVGIGHFEPLRHYAEVHLKMEPGEPGTGIQVVTECSEDLLARNWQRLIMTHVEEREHRGVLIGAPLTDVKITVIAGRAHLKHTEGGDFRQATYRAIRQGLMQSNSVLLEPYYEFELDVPMEMVGRAMTDMEMMCGKFELQETASGKGLAHLTGIVPVSTVGDYSVRVISYTKGLGHFSCVLKGYYPCHDAQEIVEEKGYEPEADVYNTADSVFCMHGVGEIIPWHQVKEYAHVDTSSGRLIQSENVYYEGMKPLSGKSGDLEERILGVEEIDWLVENASSANRRDSDAGKPGYLRKKVKVKENIVDTRERTYSPKKPMPKYLLVDGYNVIFAWDDLKELAAINIDGARGKLMDVLCNYQTMVDKEIILVFDAYRVAGHKTEFIDYQNIHVVYTKEAETADFYIEHFTHENSKKYDITVVTSDGLEQIIIRGQGCQLISSREFEKEIAETSRRFKQEYMDKNKETGNKMYLGDFISKEDKENLNLF